MALATILYTVSTFSQHRIAETCSIASLDVEVNENVSPGQLIAIVSCGDAYEVTLDLPESLIATVSTYTPVSIRFGAISDVVFDGEITEIAVASARDSAAFPVVIRIFGSHPSLRSGLAADVTFQLDSAAGRDVVVLPVAAVINDPDGTYVYVAVPDDAPGEAIVERRPIVLGELSQQGIEVTDGIAVGDRIVTAGVSVIRAGQRVLLPEPARD